MSQRLKPGTVDLAGELNSIRRADEEMYAETSISETHFSSPEH
jgi:hypothetical protein